MYQIYCEALGTLDTYVKTQTAEQSRSGKVLPVQDLLCLPQAHA